MPRPKKKTAKRLGKTPLMGVSFRFKRDGKKVRLALRLGTDIQEKMGAKAGDRVIIKYNDENPYKFIVSKTNSIERGTYKLSQNNAGKALIFSVTWGFKKPKAALCQFTMNATARARKNSVTIELT